MEECDKTIEVPKLGYSVPQPRFELNVYVTEWSVTICNGETLYIRVQNLRNLLFSPHISNHYISFHALLSLLHCS